MTQVSFESFFGCPLGEVSHLNRLIALYGDRPVPEWLRGRPKYADLPRLDASRRSFEFVFSVDGLRDREIARRVQWIVDALHGPWTLADIGLCLDAETDAVHYKLRWG